MYSGQAAFFYKNNNNHFKGYEEYQHTKLHIG